jgi:hypothetical protein
VEASLRIITPRSCKKATTKPCCSHAAPKITPRCPHDSMKPQAFDHWGTVAASLGPYRKKMPSRSHDAVSCDCLWSEKAATSCRPRFGLVAASWCGGLSRLVATCRTYDAQSTTMPSLMVIHSAAPWRLHKRLVQIPQRCRKRVASNF